MVQSTFNDLEALEIAITIEKRGERFYTLALAYAQEEEVTNMLKELAKQEQEHAKTFQSIYSQLRAHKDDFDDTYLYDPEVSAYFRAMVESTIFPSDEQQDKALNGIRGISDIFALGIQAEKDSILFYTEMVIHSKFTEAKEAFRRLINAEKKHLIDLQEKLRYYRK